MKCKEALDILIQATGQLQATRQVHETIAEAIRTLAAATAAEAAGEPADGGPPRPPLVND